MRFAAMCPALFFAFYLLITDVGGTFKIEKSIGELMLSSDNFLEFDEFSTEEDYNATVSFNLFTRKVNSSEQLLINNVATLKQSDFNHRRKTIFLIHGYNNDVDSPMMEDTKNALLEFHDVNVINVDWSCFAKTHNYLKAATSVEGVGQFTGEFIEFLIAQGQSEADIHVVGHSLGAHVAGFAGKYLNVNNRTIARITGLDPAFPGFYNTIDTNGRLSSSDAAFVDCIHTCGGKLGYPVPLCQADFFPNGGMDVQPGCSLFDFGSCSHARSYLLFAESMNPTHLFNAQSCSGIHVWAPYNCHDEGALMGYPASPKYKGSLYLTTNSQPPFAKNITSS